MLVEEARFDGYIVAIKDRNTDKKITLITSTKLTLTGIAGIK